MKAFFIIIFLFVSNVLMANMDNYCNTKYFHPDFTNPKNQPKYGELRDTEFIEKHCERNNILMLYDVSDKRDAIVKWCRFDREIYTTNKTVTCVLYDNKPRTRVEED
tara:strand:+ start:134 stop:454 length:321 start_codon:yes stop_codon:yes gene_type:complete